MGENYSSETQFATVSLTIRFIDPTGLKQLSSRQFEDAVELHRPHRRSTGKRGLCFDGPDTAMAKEGNGPCGTDTKEHQLDFWCGLGVTDGADGRRIFGGS